MSGMPQAGGGDHSVCVTPVAGVHATTGRRGCHSGRRRKSSTDGCPEHLEGLVAIKKLGWTRSAEKL